MFNQHTLSGDSAITKAVQEAIDGKTVSLELGEEVDGEWESRGFLNFGLGDVEGKACLRWCGKEGEPNGEASSSIVASWWSSCMDEDRLCEAIKVNCHGFTPFERI